MTTTKVHLKRRPAVSGGKPVRYWTLHWTDSKGRVTSKSIGRVGKMTRAQAEAERRKKIVDLGSGKVSPDRLRRMTLKEFATFHEENAGHGMRPSTIAGWRDAVHHAVAALGNVNLGDLAWTNASDIRESMLANGASTMTVRKTQVTLSAMLKRAQKWNLINENPFRDQQLDPMTARVKRIFSQAELDAMVEASDLWWATMITVAYTSGLRRAELWYLRWKDIDVEAGTVRIEEHHAGEYIANGTCVPILAWKPKTKNSTRTVPIPPQTLSALQRLRMTSSDGSPYVFVSVKRLRTINVKACIGTLRDRYELLNNFNRQFAGIQAEAKAEMIADANGAAAVEAATNWVDGCFHDLRKTFGTRAASNNVPMHELQKHMGHANISTTTEFYVEVEASAADRLRAAFKQVA